MSVFESIERYPVEYLPSGDQALLLAWIVSGGSMGVIVCLEDGTVRLAGLSEIRLNYRWDMERQRWVDVSRVEDGYVDADQAPADDGGPQVSG